jgi:hypothetical protein
LNAIEAMERHYRIRVICHAIRHLLDHALDQTNEGDVQAIDLLQSAINPKETDSAPICEMPGRSAEAAITHIPHNRMWQAG